MRAVAGGDAHVTQYRTYSAVQEPCDDGGGTVNGSGENEKNKKKQLEPNPSSMAPMAPWHDSQSEEEGRDAVGRR